VVGGLGGGGGRSAEAWRPWRKALLALLEGHEDGGDHRVVGRFVCGVGGAFGCRGEALDIRVSAKNPGGR